MGMILKDMPTAISVAVGMLDHCRLLGPFYQFDGTLVLGTIARLVQSVCKRVTGSLICQLICSHIGAIGKLDGIIVGINDGIIVGINDIERIAYRINYVP